MHAQGYLSRDRASELVRHIPFRICCASRECLIAGQPPAINYLRVAHTKTSGASELGCTLIMLKRVADFILGQFNYATLSELVEQALELFVGELINKESFDGAAESLERSRLGCFTFD